MIAPASIMSAWLGLVRIPPPAAMPAGRRLNAGAGLDSDRQIGVGVCRAQSLQVWHWMRLPMGTTSIARMTESIRRAKRVINQFLEGGCNTSPFVLGLLHQDVDHVQLRIYAEISTTTAVPLEFTD
jgi:hypothetical protein